jgi:hypothetical protein
MGNRDLRESRNGGVEVAPQERSSDYASGIEIDVAVEHNKVPLNLITAAHNSGAGVSPATLPSNSLSAILLSGIQVRTAPRVVSRV